MALRRIKTISVSQRHFFSLSWLIFSLSFLAAPTRLYAFHETASSPSTTSTQTTSTTQPTKPVKPGTTTTSAMTGGLGASVDGFNIQSFQADLFTGSAGAEIPIVVPPGAAGVAPKISLSYTSSLVDDYATDKKIDQGDWVGLGWNLDTGGFVLRDTKGTITTNDDKFKLIFGGVTHELINQR